MDQTKDKRSGPDIALLFHCAHWESSRPAWQASDNVYVADIEDSAVGRLYNYRCREFLEDDGDPLLYGAYCRMRPSDDRDCHSRVSRFCTVLVALARQPLFDTQQGSTVQRFNTINGALLHQNRDVSY